MFIDMDIPSIPPSRTGTPDSTPGAGTPIREENETGSRAETVIQTDESDQKARKKGIGNLMMSAKQDTVVPEFNMDAFNF